MRSLCVDRFWTLCYKSVGILLNTSRPTSQETSLDGLGRGSMEGQSNFEWKSPRNLKTKDKTKVKTVPGRNEDKSPKPSSGDCVNGLARVPLCQSRTTGRQTDGSTG